jgi:hypothetical protein
VHAPREVSSERLTAGRGRPVPDAALSVVVPTHRPGPRLDATLAAVLADPTVDEVIAVLDPRVGPGPGPLDRLAALDRRVRPARALLPGPNAARARGAALARGRVVWFLDDDVVPAPGVAAGHLAHHCRPGRVVVGYMPVAETLVQRFATAAIYARDYEGACRGYAHDPRTILTDLWGGNVSMRRSDCLRVGIATSAFGHSQHEDREFGLRCLDAGLTGVFDRSLVAEHRYVRPAGAFLRLARDQVGASRALHALHADAVGPWDPGCFRANVPRKARWALTAARAPGAASAEVAALRGVAAVSGVLGARRAAKHALTLARAVTQDAAARAAEAQPTTSDAIPATIMTKPRTT